MNIPLFRKTVTFTNLSGIAVTIGSVVSFYKSCVDRLANHRCFYRSLNFGFTAIDSSQINPYHSQAHNNLGQILQLEGSLEEALKHYETACDSDRTSRKAQFNRGRVLLAMKRLDEAIDAFMETLEPEDEETARYLYALGATYVRSGDLENGLKYTEEAKQAAEKYQLESLLPAINRDLEQLKKALNR